jgi:hypothetical protein
MKTLIIGSLLFSTASFAQTIDVNGLKSLLTARQVSLERVNVGMSKKVVTTAKDGDCGYMTNSVLSVLKVDGDKIIIYKKTRFSPQNSAACRAAGYTAGYDENIVFFEDKPTLAKNLSDLDASAINIKGIGRAGEVINMTMDKGGEVVAFQYNLTKPFFKHLTSAQGSLFKTVVEDVADIDVKTVNLKEIALCDEEFSEAESCTIIDMSDILQ